MFDCKRIKELEEENRKMKREKLKLEEKNQELRDDNKKLEENKTFHEERIFNLLRENLKLEMENLKLKECACCCNMNERKGMGKYELRNTRDCNFDYFCTVDC